MLYCQGQRNQPQLHSVSYIPPHLTEPLKSRSCLGGQRQREGVGRWNPSPPFDQLALFCLEELKIVQSCIRLLLTTESFLNIAFLHLLTPWVDLKTAVPSPKNPCRRWSHLLRRAEPWPAQPNKPTSPVTAWAQDSRAQLSQCHENLTIWVQGGCGGWGLGCHENPNAGISSFGEAEPYFAGSVGF